MAWGRRGVNDAAKANIPIKSIQVDYTLRLYPIPKLGLWFEVGPAKGNAWKGALFGLSGGEITAHGVGPSGELPEGDDAELYTIQMQ